jgi:hypothetical protein
LRASPPAGFQYDPAHSDGFGCACGRCWCRRRWWRRRSRRHARCSLLGQIRLPRQQPRYQPLADVDARAHGLVLHGASADHARPARGAAAPLHVQRRSASEPEPRSAALCGAAVLLELGAFADDEVGHAGRVHTRLHGWLVARLPRLGCVQPQRHDADVRDAVGS